LGAGASYSAGMSSGNPTPTPDLAPPPRLPSRAGSTRLRVRYAECDPMRVAHHASYPIWMEEARTHLLRVSGVSYADLEEQGVFLVITKLEIKYRRPIRYDDVIEVRVRHVPAGRIKIRHEYELALVERLGATPDATDPATPRDGVCAVASTELACVGADGRPMQLPEWLTAEPADAGGDTPA